MPHTPKSGLLFAICALGLLCGQWGPATGAESQKRPSNDVVSGDALFVQGRFAEATAVYERVLEMDPKSGSALAALSRMRLYQHRESEANELARRALAAMPDNALAAQVIGSVEARRKAAGGDVYQLIGQPSPVSLAFVATDPLPVATVKVGDRTANFVLDTGAPDIAVSRSLATSLGLPITAAGVGTFAGGQHARVERTTVPEISLGGMRVRNVPAVISPADLRLSGVQTDGIIGTGFLMHFLSTIDYCKGKLVLAQRSSSAAFQRSAAASNANFVPMWLVGDHFIFAQASIEKVKGLFNIDTGLAGGALVATKRTMEAAGINIEGNRVGVGHGGGGQVPFVSFKADAALGRLTRRQVTGVYMTGGDPYGIFPFQVSGALSHGFFRRSQLTFDFDSMKLITRTCR